MRRVMVHARRCADREGKAANRRKPAKRAEVAKLPRLQYIFTIYNGEDTMFWRREIGNSAWRTRSTLFCENERFLRNALFSLIGVGGWGVVRTDGRIDFCRSSDFCEIALLRKNCMKNVYSCRNLRFLPNSVRAGAACSAGRAKLRQKRIFLKKLKIRDALVHFLGFFCDFYQSMCTYTWNAKKPCFFDFMLI